MNKNSPDKKPYNKPKLVESHPLNSPDEIRKVKCGHPKTPMPIMGELEIESYVLEDGTAVISSRGIQKAIGLGAERGTALSDFLKKSAIAPYITPEFSRHFNNPIKFDLSTIYGGTVQYGIGFEATFFPELCDVILRAREASALKSQKDLEVAQKAEIITRALSRVGIIALIYEWTGYEKFKSPAAYRVFVEAYLSEQVRKWAKEFPDEFFVQLDRIYNNQPTTSQKRPKYYAKFIRKYVYKPLEDGHVLEELDMRNPANEKGIRKHRHHSHLNEEIGLPTVKAQIWQVIGALKVSANKKKFEENFARLMGQTYQMDLFEE